jgi:cardiolipin synthase
MTQSTFDFDRQSPATEAEFAAQWGAKKIHQIAGQQLILLRNGAEFFPSLLEAIELAQQSVCLETYIFSDDISGQRIASALCAAAQRGVKVQILLDGFGSSDFPATRLQDLQRAGVQVLWFRRESERFSLRRKRLRRLHRKLALVDEKIAFVGGINIQDDSDGTMTRPRLDYAVRVEGAVTTEVLSTMRRLWFVVSWANFRRRDKPSWPSNFVAETASPVRLLLRDNFRHRREIEHAYLKAIDAAEIEIIIANAYFLPGRKFRRALQQARLRGVRVILLLQGRVEYRLQHYATLALYDDLLSSDIEIFEYQRSYLHAKVAVIDRHWATVGSSNIDPFSLWLAREANLEINDAGFAEALRADLWREIEQGARKIEFSIWRRRQWLTHILLMASYGMVRWLLGALGYAHERDDY